MTKQHIKIELIHDVVCSWCPIGYNNIKSALAEYESELDVEFRFLPYELNPEMPKEGERIDVHLKRRNDWSTEQLLRYREDLVKTATRAGLVYDFGKRTHYWHTAKAHTLIHLAEKFGKQEAMNQELITQYFENGLDVSDPDCLVEVARSVGIDREAVISAFSSQEIAAEIAEKYARARSFNVRSVPTFVINEREVLRGSNSVEFFAKYLSAYLARAAA